MRSKSKSHRPSANVTVDPLARFTINASSPVAASASLRVLLVPGGERALAEMPRPAGSVEFLVGPEGGLAPEETAAALRAGFTAARLGPRILRTETAALAALAAMNVLWGDWRE